MSLEQSTEQESNVGTGQERRAAPQRKDRRGLTLASVLGVMVLLTILRLWPLYTASRNIAGVETFSGLARDHQSGAITYSQVPPVGGVHSPTWQNCGIYDQPIANENAVHSLEHGAVWITYQPNLSPTDIQQLRRLVQGRNYALLSPYPDLPAPVIATGWGVQLQVDNANDLRLEKFLGRYMQGPQTPEPGALCSGGGTGIPASR
jgi:hypothetical protein